MQESFSVVIPTFNRSDLLAHCLNAWLNECKAKYDVEVFVIDSKSSDDTDTIVARYQRQGLNVKLLQAPNVVGTKRNVGATASRGDILIFVDDDCVPQPGFLEACIGALLSAGQRKTIVSGEVRFPDNQVRTSNFARYRDSRHFRGVSGQLKPLEFTKIVTMNMCCYRDIFLAELGGFDETFIGYGGEDFELAWRAKNAGWALVEGWQKVEHREPASRLGEWQKKFIRAGEHGGNHMIHVNPQAQWAIRSSWFLEPGYPHRSLLGSAVAASVRWSLVPAISSLLRWVLEKTDRYSIFYLPLAYRYVCMTNVLIGVRRRSERIVDTQDVRNGWYTF